MNREISSLEAVKVADDKDDKDDKDESCFQDLRRCKKDCISICLLISVCGGNSVKSEKKKSNCSSKISHFPFPHSTKEDDLSTFPCFYDGQNHFVLTENDFVFFF